MGGRGTQCENRTVVILGRCGNGKSAVGNSILGRKAFKSRASPSGVTLTTQIESTVLPTGETLDVIDTPGLCDLSMGSEFISRELVKCIELAKDGIHAVLIVFSVTNRFTRGEDSALRMLLKFFGPEIINQLIVVFTGGDSLEENEESLEDYLHLDCPEPLLDFLRICKHRRVCFDNKTKDESKKVAQVQDIVALVDRVVEENGGQPYTDQWFEELQEMASIRLQVDEEDYDLRELADCSLNARDEHLKRITEKAETKLQETVSTLQEQISKERAERAEAEQKSKDELAKLVKSLKKTKNEAAKSQKQVETKLQETVSALREQLSKERAERAEAEQKSKDELAKLVKSLKKTKDEAAKSQKQVETKLQETVSALQEQLSKERAERAEAEQKSKDELAKLVKSLKKAKDEAAKSQKQAETKLQETVSTLQGQLSKERAERAEAEQKTKDELAKLVKSLKKINDEAAKSQKQVRDLQAVDTEAKIVELKAI